MEYPDDKTIILTSRLMTSARSIYAITEPIEKGLKDNGAEKDTDYSIEIK